MISGRGKREKYRDKDKPQSRRNRREEQEILNIIKTRISLMSWFLLFTEQLPNIKILTQMHGNTEKTGIKRITLRF